MLHWVDIDLELSRTRGLRKETREQRGFSHGSLLWSFKLESFDRRSPLPTNLSLSPYPSPKPKLILTSQSKQNVGLVKQPAPGVLILRTAQRKSSISSYSSPYYSIMDLGKWNWDPFLSICQGNNFNIFIQVVEIFLWPYKVLFYFITLHILRFLYDIFFVEITGKQWYLQYCNGLSVLDHIK